MAVKTARRSTAFSEISETVLAETSVIRLFGNKPIQGGVARGESLEVYVHNVATLQIYVPGVGVSVTEDDSQYVTVANRREIAVNEILDGLTAEEAPADYVVQRLTAGVAVIGEDFDAQGFSRMVTDSPSLIDKSGTVTAGSLIVGNWYEIFTIGDTDFTLIGASSNTIGVKFKATGAGVGTGTAFSEELTKPTTATIYQDILNLAQALDEVKAPKMVGNNVFGPMGFRALIVNPEINNFLASPDAKVQLSTDKGDEIQATGFVGFLAGFAIFMTNLLPAGTNMIGLHDRGFVHKDDFVKNVILQNLDQSGQFIGDSAIQGRNAYKQGVIRPELIVPNRGQA